MNLAVDAVDPRERNEMMGVAGGGIVLRQLDQVSALQVVHGSHMYVIGTENFHMFFDHHGCNHSLLHSVRFDNPQRCRMVPVPPRQELAGCGNSQAQRFVPSRPAAFQMRCVQAPRATSSLIRAALPAAFSRMLLTLRSNSSRSSNPNRSSGSTSRRTASSIARCRAVSASGAYCLVIVTASSRWIFA